VSNGATIYTVENCNFTDCISTGSAGGALHIELTNGG
jgi:hypothetical protein